MATLPVVYDIKNGANPVVPSVFLDRNFHVGYPKGEKRFRERIDMVQRADPSVFFVISKKENDNVVVYRLLHNHGRIYGCGVFWLNFSDANKQLSPFVTPILNRERIAYAIVATRPLEHIQHKAGSSPDRCTVAFCASKNSPFQIQLTPDGVVKCLAFSTLLGKHVMPLCIHGEYSHFKYRGVVYGCTKPEDKRDITTKYQPVMEI